MFIVSYNSKIISLSIAPAIESSDSATNFKSRVGRILNTTWEQQQGEGNLPLPWDSGVAIYENRVDCDERYSTFSISQSIIPSKRYFLDNNTDACNNAVVIALCYHN
mmetsp:Transcript_21561/g.39000  ORF Transcript_21561/g.39000 Transcript_21561/m.39000 type:complete len:107 (-) Transcript_21561:62-382(-)